METGILTYTYTFFFFHFHCNFDPFLNHFVHLTHTIQTRYYMFIFTVPAGVPLLCLPMLTTFHGIDIFPRTRTNFNTQPYCNLLHSKNSTPILNVTFLSTPDYFNTKYNRVAIPSFSVGYFGKNGHHFV